MFGNATQSIGPLLGPLIGFLFTLGAVVFIALRADKTERSGALEALQAAAADGGGAEPPATAPQPAGEAPAGPTVHTSASATQAAPGSETPPQP